MDNKSALIVIDAQKGLFDETDETYKEDEIILKRIAGLLAKARDQHIPIIYLQHDGGPGHPLEGKTPGWQIHPIVTPRADDIVLGKRASDSFYETPLHEKLQSLGVNRLIITGAMIEYCVDTTCRRAASLNYDVWLVADGHLTGDNGVLTAAQIIAHHNHILAEVAHPTHPIKVQPAAEIQF